MFLQDLFYAILDVFYVIQVWMGAFIFTIVNLFPL